MLITQECTLRLYLRAHFNIRNTCYDGMRCAKSSVRMNVMVICLCTYLSVNLHHTMVCFCRVQSEGCTLWRYVRAQSIVKNARYGTEYLRAHSSVKNARYSRRSVHKIVWRCTLRMVDKCTVQYVRCTLRWCEYVLLKAGYTRLVAFLYFM